MTMLDVFKVALTNIGAGSDTTSISFAAVMWYLIHDARVYHKVCYALRCHHLNLRADLRLVTTAELTYAHTATKRNRLESLLS
jgi:hypothetical protein